MSALFSTILAAGWGLLIYLLTTTPNLVVAPENWFNSLMMSSAHFLFFGVQAVLLFRAFTFHLKPPLSIYWALLLTSLYGLIIELAQRQVPGRSADPLDWLLDTLGALFFLYFMRKFLYHKAKKRTEDNL